MTMPDILFSPLVPWPWIAVPAALALLLSFYGLARRARGAALRLVPLLVLVLALLNPRLAEQERLPLDDVAVVVVDDSQSQLVGDRRLQAETALAGLLERMEKLPNLEVRVERVTSAPGRDDGTRLFAAVDRALSDVPRRRLAGVVLVTDGQVHDLPADAKAVGGPVHVLLTGQPGGRDRRLVIEQAPTFGIVNNSVRVTLRIDDADASGTARLVMRRDGGASITLAVPLNSQRQIDIPIDHAGQSVVEFEVEAAENELSLANNRAAVSITGVRDRLRVLLVSGQAHAGERTWRNLLKADPSVDLVHFTILRPPEKDDNTPLRELALISFPVRELFEEKLNDFDLIIFDRYRRQGVLPLLYYENIAEYVRNGGALMMAVGPEFDTAMEFIETPLEGVLPGMPTGDVVEMGFRPRLTEKGGRHPVTAGLPGGGANPEWGRWLRQISVSLRSGTPLLSGADEQPLLVLDRVGEGRVAQLLSDTIWLWSRGFEGGGPQAELLRRLAHWLMKEPELDEETLRAEVRGDELHVTRRSLEDPPPEVTITQPDGGETRAHLTDQGDGRATATLPVEQAGLYRISDGSLSAIAAVGSLNPLEMADLRATEEKLDPAVRASGGGMRWLAEDGIPDLRRVQPGRETAGRGWFGLRANGDHIVTAVRDVPLLPGALLLLLVVGGLMLAWRREGR